MSSTEIKNTFKLKTQKSLTEETPPVKSESLESRSQALTASQATRIITETKFRTESLKSEMDISKLDPSNEERIDLRKIDNPINGPKILLSKGSPKREWKRSPKKTARVETSFDLNDRDFAKSFVTSPSRSQRKRQSKVSNYKVVTSQQMGKIADNLE